ncbi:MFS transporter [Campylobacter coli]|nr:MFS transporter [Campylobacter coli]
MQQSSITINNTYQIKILITLCLGVFGLISMELGVMGIIPLISEKFGVSVSDAGWSVSIFALIVMCCAPIAPMLCANFNPKKLMLFCLAIFSLSSLASMFVNDFWLHLILRSIPAFFHPIYLALAFSTAANLADDKSKVPHIVAKIFMAISAGLVLGVPLSSYFGGNFSFEMAMAFYVVINSLAFFITLFFMPEFKKTSRIKVGKQLLSLRYALLWISMLAVFCISTGYLGFYSYYSEFLFSVSKMSFTNISLALFIYGFASIIGNNIAGKTLVNHSNQTLIFASMAMILIYALIFVNAAQFAIMLTLSLILGIVNGVMNNAMHYIITFPFPRAKDFTNGLFISVSNISISVGATLCGLVISIKETKYIAISSIIMVGLGLILVLVRMRLEDKKLKI